MTVELENEVIVQVALASVSGLSVATQRLAGACPNAASMVVQSTATATVRSPSVTLFQIVRYRLVNRSLHVLNVYNAHFSRFYATL